MSDRRAIPGAESEEDREILAALVGRGQEGMTVLELRAAVDADIDTIETSLTQLKREGLIVVEQHDETPVIRPHDSVVPEDEGRATEESIVGTLLAEIRKRLPF